MRLKISSESLINCALLFLLLGGCFRWIYLGIGGGLFLQGCVLFVGLIFLFLAVNFGFRVRKDALIWLLYPINIWSNLILHNKLDNTTILYAIVASEITLYVLLSDMRLFNYKKIIKIVIVYGLINALFVIVQFLLGDVFNNALYSLLNSDGVTTASHYYRLGYYFGFFYTPSDPAGMIAFAMFALLLYFTIRRHGVFRLFSIKTVLLLLMFIPLLLTGKKGILFISIFSFIIVILMLYANRKQWIRAISLVVIISAVAIVLYFYIRSNQDMEIFRRLNTFFDNYQAGENFDSNRSFVWGYALSAWQDNLLFGIGWRNFRFITTAIYGSAHEVNCDYLQLLCETGIVGLTLTLIPMIVFLKRTLLVMKIVISDKFKLDEQWCIICAAFIQFFFVVYAMFEIPFYDVTFYTLYIISCIIINRAYRDCGGKTYMISPRE